MRAVGRMADRLDVGRVVDSCVLFTLVCDGRNMADSGDGGRTRVELPLLDAVANGRATEWSGWSQIEPTLIEIEFAAGGLKRAMAAQVRVTETPEVVQVALVVGRYPEFAGRILAGRGFHCKVRVALASPLAGREVRPG